jgi:hypothetical protein
MQKGDLVICPSLAKRFGPEKQQTAHMCCRNGPGKLFKEESNQSDHQAIFIID